MPAAKVAAFAANSAAWSGSSSASSVGDRLASAPIVRRVVPDVLVEALDVVVVVVGVVVVACVVVVVVARGQRVRARRR